MAPPVPTPMRSPIESTLLPAKLLRVTNVSDRWKQMMLSLSTARSLAMKTNWEAQQQCKLQHDNAAKTSISLELQETGFWYTSSRVKLASHGSYLFPGMGQIELFHEMILTSQ